MSPRQIVEAAFHAAALPMILEENLALREQIGKLESQVKSLSSATPKLEGATPAAAANGNKEQEALRGKVGIRPMDATRLFTESLRKAMSGTGE
jgi:hypothetical protein